MAAAAGGSGGCPASRAENRGITERFDRIMGETRPDKVVVTTVDSARHLYITRATELGADEVT